MDGADSISVWAMVDGFLKDALMVGRTPLAWATSSFAACCSGE